MEGEGEKSYTNWGGGKGAVCHSWVHTGRKRAYELDCMIREKRRLEDTHRLKVAHLHAERLLLIIKRGGGARTWKL